MRPVRYRAAVDVGDHPLAGPPAEPVGPHLPDRGGVQRVADHGEIHRRLLSPERDPERAGKRAARRRDAEFVEQDLLGLRQQPAGSLGLEADGRRTRVDRRADGVLHENVDAETRPRLARQAIQVDDTRR